MSFRKRNEWMVVVATAVLAICFNVSNAVGSSVTYNFATNVSGNSNAGAGGGFNVTVSQTGVTQSGKVQVSFLFANNSSEASSITRIYFYDGAILGATMDSFVSSTGVNFVNPDTLPGNGNGSGPAHLPGFENKHSVQFKAMATPPIEPSGIHPGETLQINFTLQGGITFDDLIESITNGMEGEFNPGNELVIGVHVQGFDDGGSDSFVITVIPLPAPVWMGMIGLAGVMYLRRRHMR